MKLIFKILCLSLVITFFACSGMNKPNDQTEETNLVESGDNTNEEQGSNEENGENIQHPNPENQDQDNGEEEGSDDGEENNDDEEEPPPPPPPPPPPEEDWGTTYYIRPDGGTFEQCNGRYNEAYSGQETQDCAWKHPFIALPPGGSSRIAASDRIIIANGDYRMGISANAGENCSSDFPWDCYMSRLPSGIDKDHPTRLYGENWKNCTTKPRLYSVERAYQIINLVEQNNISLNCIEITDNSGCIEYHPDNAIRCNRDSYPYGDWGLNGIYAHDSSDITLKNLNIHGFAHAGIWAVRLSDWTLENVRIATNGKAGWHGDIFGRDGNNSNSGTMSFKNVTVEWNGCAEAYPSGDIDHCWGQSTNGYGDGIGLAATEGTWIFEDTKILYNSSDGLDLLYHIGSDPVILDRVHAEGNAGNQIKFRGNGVVRNSIIIGNCANFYNSSYSILSGVHGNAGDICRSGGNTMAFAFDEGNNISVINSAIYSEGDCLIEAVHSDGGNAATCNNANFYLYNNILVGDLDFTQGDGIERSCLIWTNCNVNIDMDYNSIFGTKNPELDCPQEQHNICIDPQLIDIAFNNAAYMDDNNFDMHPTDNSPVINSGLPVSTKAGNYSLSIIEANRNRVPDIDYENTNRPLGEGVDLGAYEIK